MVDENKEIDYKKFYKENRIPLLQYKNLRENFNTLIDNVLGKDYYNLGMDIYECDRISCEDISRKANESLLTKLFRKCKII
jgi:hypothetical protein